MIDHQPKVFTSYCRKCGNDASCGCSRLPDAEEILADALRQLGVRRRFRAGTLKPATKRAVIRAIKEYARSWLRARAEHLLEEIAELSEAKSLFGRAKDLVSNFFGTAKQFVREAFVAGALVLSGPAEITPAEIRAIEENIAVQHAYLDQFENEIVAEGKPLNGTFVARAEQYGAAVWGSTEKLKRRAAIESEMYAEESRVLGAAEHCEDCPPLSKEVIGWRPIGTLPDIGDTRCRIHCECHFVFR